MREVQAASRVLLAYSQQRNKDFSPIIGTKACWNINQSYILSVQEFQENKHVKIKVYVYGIPLLYYFYFYWNLGPLEQYLIELMTAEIFDFLNSFFQDI